MNMYIIMSCFFERIVLINPVTGEEIPGSERGYGMLSRETDYGLEPDYRQCSYYTPDDYQKVFDGWMQAARFFTFLSALLGFVGLCVLILSICLAFSSPMFEQWLFCIYIWAAVFIMFSFLMYGAEFCDQNKCKFSLGGGWAISTFMFWLTAANTVKSMGQPPPLDEYDNIYGDDDEDLYYETEYQKYPRIDNRPVYNMNDEYNRGFGDYESDVVGDSDNYNNNNNNATAYSDHDETSGYDDNRGYDDNEQFADELPYDGAVPFNNKGDDATDQNRQQYDDEQDSDDNNNNDAGSLTPMEIRDNEVSMDDDYGDGNYGYQNDDGDADNQIGTINVSSNDVKDNDFNYDDDSRAHLESSENADTELRGID